MRKERLKKDTRKEKLGNIGNILSPQIVMQLI